MDSKLIMQCNALDLLFENRNKSYGAYELRKFYDKRLLKSLGLLLAGIALISAFSFLPKKKTPGFFTDELSIPPLSKPVKKEALINKPLLKTKNIVASHIAFAGRTLITDKKTDTLVTIKLRDIIGNTTITSLITGDPGIPTPPNTGSSGPVALPVKAPDIKKTEPLELSDVDFQPSFPGGMDAFYRFLRKNLSTPRELEPGEDITVQVRFVVGFEGKLQAFQIVKDGGTDFNNEVMRVMKKMPGWIPGKNKGENVAVYYTIPVRFTPAD